MQQVERAGGTVEVDDEWHSVVVDGEWRLGVQRATAQITKTAGIRHHARIRHHHDGRWRAYVRDSPLACLCA